MAFVGNVLKQEIYLKEISNKFGLSEQSLFNELGIQQQVKEQQHLTPKKATPQPQPKLEVITSDFTKANTALLYLEEQMVELMLKYGDYIIEMKDAEDKVYQTTVIEEVICRMEEDNCEIQSETNKKIINEIKQGIQTNELRSERFSLL